MATAAELKARLAKYAVKKEPENDAPKVTETTTPAAQEQAVRTEGMSQTPEVLAREVSETPAAAAEVVVRTDVQSTDVVVVERPAVDSLEPGVSVPREQGTDLDTTNPVHAGFLQRLADLETALLERDPLMKTHLGAIHKTMIEYEEIANLLRPEEIAKIMAAQQQHTGIVLRAETLGKSKAATNKKAAQLGLGDL